ncbi:ATP-dependent Clp protease proteolytic subunit [Cellulosimicrobium sp. XJ-DQ-B-000]|uniref:SDH family Clp fold serine proteinase n=1 Tax=Cellulosimicrobium sp. XJ-DQ-B-000 TaxID=3072182 RepID=UPI002807C7FB|nr:ATP-dependent Clp protease proteolytic subunit [Cellulosimicrobium sp. XJ-DQ-B-000]MDQ8041953.1 ATP-dependent Clp protease proteolytic subunit [Cellulosimicrobium sp. XJ-DQ-B-000]
MGSWDDVQGEIQAAGTVHDVIRRRYVAALAEYTGRNVIIYYSGWLEKEAMVRQGLTGVEVNDGDKNGFMATIHGLDRSKGLDLILHTPGGNVAATESLVDYLRAMFGTDIRVIVPQLAMSAGTMIALSSAEIVMGKHSSLGPIDPQIGGMAAHGIVEEFERARVEISADPSTMAIWQPIIAKYPPTFVGECQKAIAWADSMVKKWLTEGMFSGKDDPATAADTVLSELASHALTLSHERHISAEKARELGLKISMLEDDPDLQEHVLSLHHAAAQTLGETAAFKIIENQNGISYISAVQARPLH